MIAINGINIAANDIEAISVGLRQRSAGECSIVAARDFDAAAIFSFDDAIDLLYNSQPLFSGRCIGTPTIGAVQEAQTYQFAGPWHDLDTIPLMADYGSFNPATAAITTKQKSRVTLGQNTLGAEYESGRQIEAIIDYAISKGAAITKGAMFAGRIVPQTQVLDVSCATAISTLLRWHPDIVVYFVGRQINFKPRASLDTVTLQPGDVETFNISPMTRKITGLSIFWEIGHTHNGEARTEIIRHDAGVGAGGRNTIAFTIALGGVATTTQTQEVGTRTWPANGSNDQKAREWYQAQFPWLQSAAWSDIAIVNHAVVTAETFEDAADPVNPNSTRIGKPATDPTLYPRELIAGAIAPWMKVRQAAMRATAKVAYDGNDPEIIKRLDTTHDFGGTTGVKPAFEAEVKFTGTNAANKTYETSESSGVRESPISNLAADYFAEISAQEYEGGFVIRGLNPKPTPLGSKITIQGKSGVLQGLQYSFDASGLTVNGTIGAPEHLAPQDWNELARASKENRPSWSFPEERTGGRGSAGSTIGGGFSTATSSADQLAIVGNSAVGFPFRVIDASDATTAKVRLATPETAKVWTSALSMAAHLPLANKAASISAAVDDLLWVSIMGTAAGGPTSAEWGVGQWPGYPLLFVKNGANWERTVFPIGIIVDIVNPKYTAWPGEQIKKLIGATTVKIVQAPVPGLLTADYPFSNTLGYLLTPFAGFFEP